MTMLGVRMFGILYTYTQHTLIYTRHVDTSVCTRYLFHITQTHRHTHTSKHTHTHILFLYMNTKYICLAQHFTQGILVYLYLSSIARDCSHILCHDVMEAHATVVYIEQERR